MLLRGRSGGLRLAQGLLVATFAALQRTPYIP